MSSPVPPSSLSSPRPPSSTSAAVPPESRSLPPPPSRRSVEPPPAMTLAAALPFRWSERRPPLSLAAPAYAGQRARIVTPSAAQERRRMPSGSGGGVLLCTSAADQRTRVQAGGYQLAFLTRA